MFIHSGATMQVIAVLNQKGGSGKTTIATHLARALQLDGADVLLVDSDPQGSARDWAAVREDQPLTVVGIDRPTIDRDLKNVARKDFVVIDGAPQAADLAVSAIKAAHFVLIPVQPSPYDIWATADLVELVKQRIEVTDGKLQAAFVVSRAIKGTRIGAEVTEALNGYGLPVLESRITQRVSYPGTAAAGSTVMDAEPDSDAAAEVRALANEIKQKLI
ncbi:ParA family partition ATPase [Kerstersia gyiorum]|jgi:chromosome partitioning protein|nr:ParA family partition ATPase [Kerstersia gyiorum]KDC25252.1 VirC1 protein [Bordetella bronchiseptica F4563]MCP1634892.1 chromosome partitioning protein [Kerstersia gyiorum]MCP1638239.1 chromosome partitioning protein [Kerstersia gyiorum]MCP1672843.1 chromosome partitioning protein [Kerstersia gyiorum]MCP1680662.1 chromosome partitioning protein [Kerstersia gyiorum]